MNNTEYIFNKVKHIMLKEIFLPLKEEEITMDASIVNDLMMDSFEIIKLAMAVEKEFGIEISDRECYMCKNVKDLVLCIQRKLR